MCICDDMGGHGNRPTAFGTRGLTIWNYQRHCDGAWVFFLKHHFARISFFCSYSTHFSLGAKIGIMLPLRLIVVTNTRLFPLLQKKKENTTDNDDERKRKRYKGKRGI
ncbi:hypothetical protein H0G86_009018 [Trichoderma simmonsii]|uniref:Uncharacterized protein n=1 Tax=Trichoderma simmonsii TaxID=1491479 RepID=A0A8G0LJP3_9HYPO|nr:hypothetical protein H0G86_009018 [Trichoderma simmonsii]